MFLPVVIYNYLYFFKGERVIYEKDEKEKLPYIKTEDAVFSVNQLLKMLLINIIKELRNISFQLKYLYIQT